MEKPEAFESTETLTTNGCSLFLFNDDVNSFQTVIFALQDVLKWNSQQSEQIAMIVHYKGKAKLKEGSYLELEPLKYGLDDRGLSTEIC